MKLFRIAMVCALAMVLWSPAARAGDSAVEKKLYEDVKPSLVAVKYTWESELGKQDFVGSGIIIGDDGLVMMPLDLVPPQYVPNTQMKNFKIVVPSDTEDETEVDATLQGRDERSNLAFVKATSPQKWKAVHFVDEPINIGDTVYSMGLLPKGSGYRAFITSAAISTRLRGPVPQVLVDGALASMGGLVFNADGHAIGYIHPHGLLEALLDNPQNPNDLPMITNSPKIYVPSSDFLPALENPPTPDKTIEIPWMGCELQGLDKATAEYFGLKNKPSVQLGDVVPGSPAEKAGLKANDIIIKMDGKPLERGDLPAELPAILTRKVQWQKPGSTVTFTIIHQKNDEPKDVVVTLAERPRQAAEAKRFYGEDLGFVVREVVFVDTYRRRMKPDTGGVVVAMLRPSAAASAAKLQNGDLILQMNGKPVTDLDQFKKDYQQFRKDKPHDAVVLAVSQPDGKEQTINIEPPQTGTIPGNEE